LRVPTRGAAAPWLESAAKLEDPLANPERIAVGHGAALVRAGKQVFLVSGERGVVGPVEGRVLAGVDDRPLDADDAAGDFVARGVTLSLDGGQTWRASPPREGFVPERVLARADGVFVAQGGGETWIWRKGTWARSSYQATGSLVRVGAAIWNGDSECPATLSADGATWARWVPDIYNTYSWAAMLQTSETPEGWPDVRRETATDPPAPPAPAPADAVTRSGCPANDYGEAEGLGGIGMSGVGAKCHGVQCARGSVGARPPETRTRIALFRDGACDAAAEVWGGYDMEGCRPTKRAPRVAFVDRREGRVQVGEPPCPPARLWSAAGLGVLACDGGAIWVAGANGRWAQEGTTRFAPEALEMADDGTLLLHVDVRGDGGVLVRAPVAAGAGAWSEVFVEGAVAWRATPGGGALAIVKGDDDTRLTLVHVRGDGSRETLVAEAALGVWDLLDVLIEDDGRVVLVLDSGKRLVRRDGTLAPP
jgi:hypothetical protein